MNLSNKLALSLASVILVSFSQGCDKPKPQEKENAAATTTATAAVSAPDNAQLELSDEDVPVAEDFIEESTKQIDESNYKTKLADLEKEVDSDNEQ